jgi:REP element-mobilizing transposase RayT
MPSTHTSLHYHLIFATKDRQPHIAPEWRTRLHEYLGGTVRGLGAVPQGIGGVADHVHLLVALKPTHCLSDFMRELKKTSSVWVAEEIGLAAFRWQEGYGAFTVSASARASVQEYIARQQEHHRTRTFREELVEFLEKSGVDYDPRYLD